MRTLRYFFAICLMAGSAFAQSALPACQGSDVSRWTNCVGTRTSANGSKYVDEWNNGSKYVGEWKDGKINGQGITYRADGTIIRSGQWANEVLVQSFAIDTNRFPFNQPTQTASATQAPVLDPLKAERDLLAGMAQSRLPECGSAWRHNCFGTETFANGAKYVGEYKDGKPVSGHWVLLELPSAR